MQKPRHTLRPWQRWTHGWPDKAWCRIRGPWLAWSQTSWCHGCYDSNICKASHLCTQTCLWYFNFIHNLLKILHFTQSHEQMCNGCRHCQANCSVQHLSIRQRMLQSKNLGEKLHWLCIHCFITDVKPYTCEARPWGNPEQLVAWWATHRYSSLVWHLCAHSQRCNAKGRSFARSCCNEVGRDNKEYISMDLAMAEKGVKQLIVMRQRESTKTYVTKTQKTPEPFTTANAWRNLRSSEEPRHAEIISASYCSKISKYKRQKHRPAGVYKGSNKFQIWNPAISAAAMGVAKCHNGQWQKDLEIAHLGLQGNLNGLCITHTHSSQSSKTLAQTIARRRSCGTADSCCLSFSGPAARKQQSSGSVELSEQTKQIDASGKWSWSSWGSCPMFLTCFYPTKKRLWWVGR